MKIVDYLQNIGIIGFIILALLIMFFLILAPLIVAILITNSIGVSGIYWWAFVIVIWFIIVGIISKLYS